MEHGQGVTRLATWLLKFCRLEAEVCKVEFSAVRAGQHYLWHVQCREYGLWDFFFDRNGLLKPLEKLLAVLDQPPVTDEPDWLREWQASLLIKRQH